MDDQPEARESYEFSVLDAQLLALPEVGPLPELADFWSGLSTRADALLSDYKLRVRQYARFDGAELVAYCYDKGYPALLCTRYRDALHEDIRAYRSKIPVLLEPDELEPDRLRAALQEVVKELDNGPAANRRGWRTQVHVLEVDQNLDLAFVELPGWHSPAVIRLKMKYLPEQLRRELGPDYRCYARANLGAEETHELFFTHWETP